MSRDRSRLWFFDNLEQARQKHSFNVWAYVLMPEHVHLLIFPPPVHSISDILSDIKQPVTRLALRYVREHAPSFLPMMRDEQPNGKTSYRFWQRGGGYDRNINEIGTIHAEIAYIHANPVGRGLVRSPDEWPWSSARFYAGRTDVPLIPDVESLPALVP